MHPSNNPMTDYYLFFVGNYENAYWLSRTVSCVTKVLQKKNQKNHPIFFVDYCDYSNNRDSSINK